MTTPANNNGVRDCDVVIVGGGLAGQLTALALASRAPQLSIALVERAEKLGGNQTWCCHLSDISHPDENEDEVRGWFLPLLNRVWDRHRVVFPTYERTLEGSYVCIRSEDLARATERTLAREGRVLLTGREVVRVTKHRIDLDSGGTLRGRLVLDARGEGPDGYVGRSAYQKFVGWELELDALAADVAPIPTLMDAGVEQHDGFRFVYTLPFSPGRLLVEDTYFSTSPVLDRALIRGRLSEHLRRHRITRYHVVREESGVLPMPWSASTRRRDDVLAIGYRGGFFHPGTGYSLARSVLVAHRIARLASAEVNVDLTATVESGLRKLAASWASDNRFARALNRLAFRYLPGGWLRSLVYSPIYRLPPATLARFYAGRTSVRDRLSLLAAPARLSFPRNPRSHQRLLGETP